MSLVQLSDAQLQQLLKQAAAEGAEIGAARALDRAGLSDEQARKDIEEVRELLMAWRSAKTNAVRTFFNLIVKWLTIAVLAGLSASFGLDLMEK